jgi:glyoxylase-like metal-dependent hydrolase (beta-lactamase superfamily II)
MFEPTSAGIRRLTLPLPTGPQHVHCYLADGTLFDTGLGLSGFDWGAHRVERIAITHFHPDHVGGAEAASEATGATVHQGAVDYAQCERVWGSHDWPERIAAWFARNGVPAEITQELIEAGHAFSAFVRFARGPALLYEGSEVDGWRTVELPGHADGHLGFVREGILVGGDHLLPRITPTVGLFPESRPDPLGDYLDSLQRVVELAPLVVLPGHGEPIEDVAGRVREIVAHHEERLERTRAALAGPPRTGYELSLELFGPTLAPAGRRFAVAESLSHAEYLVARGLAERTVGRGTLSYSAS